jgi:hypothetical protein
MSFISLFLFATMWLALETSHFALFHCWVFNGLTDRMVRKKRQRFGVGYCTSQNLSRKRKNKYHYLLHGPRFTRICAKRVSVISRPVSLTSFFLCSWKCMRRNPSIAGSSRSFNTETGIANSVQRLATGWTAGVHFPVEVQIFLFSIASKPAVRPTQWVRRLFRRR